MQPTSAKIFPTPDISYNNKTTEEVFPTKFLGFQTDNNLNWKKSH
jgi:hypothetical protein